ncbi:prepilin-type N-terminal cleavage/methylation domain-containing protein [Anaerobacillus alkaliphilus]|uniref:Prepilin-type N-terminal cleavage/methylation domain-containing protein n=1 Tax=Anaerobacillus alkaliphilus TaxID=1548597 RepID=A0A4Q0VQM7_9BACI|nr:prepilin-type N-terminal cleavage/methylation domain-containing protein [Anaerobacillus alkaliphilus]RXI98421.1 prepilin-type N-terminal cleavage/methylation domain-containing protein [Anaerobacillus alkaliphilus]
MKKSVINYFSNSKGITLIELLIALSIFSAISVVLYPVLTNGIKNYQAINSEVQLRSEADYMVGRILNEIYLFFPDAVEQVSDHKIVMKRSFDGDSTGGSISRYSVEYGIIGNPRVKKNETLVLEFNNNNLHLIKIDDLANEETIKLNSENIKLLTKENQSLDLEAMFEDYSKIELLDCPTDRPCKNGSLKITLVLDFVQLEGKRNDPMKLESTFGF